MEPVPRRSLPNANPPEKIVLCVDACRRDRLARLVDAFALNKRAIAADTEFAVVALKDAGPEWALRFTTSVADVAAAVAAMPDELEEAPDFDLSRLFELVHDEVDLPDLSADYKLEPPSCVVRAIVLYARSECAPKMSRAEPFATLARHPYFALDVVYARDERRDGRAPALDALQALDSGRSYVLEARDEPRALLECAAKLLAHPLQRCAQERACYALPR